MKMSNPHMLYLVWIMFLLSGVIIHGNRKRRKILNRFATLKVLEIIAPGINPGIRLIRSLLTIVALFCLVGALAGPLVGFKWETIEQKGVDIMICLDCSRSMLAQDIKPSRLERAKREIFDLLGMIKSDRAGLVAFAGNSILQCPLTLDHEAFNLFLNALEPDYLPVGGTDIGGAIETALNGFEKDVDSEKAIIIITDGENTTGNAVEMAKKAAKQAIKIFCIGVGSKEGAPVPDTGGGFKKDEAGGIVISKVDEPGLEKIAGLTRGVYVRSVAGDMDLDRIYDQEILGGMEKKTLKSGRQKVWENRFQWLVFPAVVLLLVEMILADNRRGIFFSVFLFAPILILTLALKPEPCFAGASASVKKGIQAYESGEYGQAEKHFIDAQLARPDMAELYYNIGGAAYKKGDFEAAVNNFTRARQTDDPVLKPKAIYNLGNALYRSGDLAGAIKEYEALLDLSPQDKDARENLEFVKKKLEEQKKEEKKKDSQQDKDQKNENKDQKNEKQKNPENKDQGDKNQENKDQENPQENKEQNKEKPGDKNSGQEKKQSPDKDQADQADSMNNDSKGKGQNQDQPENQDHDQDPGQDHGQAKDQAEIRAMDRILNRLEDKPGQALMPAYGNTRVTRDW